MLLEAPGQAPVSAPVPPRDRYLLRVFGNDAPPKGWFYTGPDPFGDFVRMQRGDHAQLNNETDRQRYIQFFNRFGYILVFKESPGLKIYTKVNLRIAQEGIRALEETMGLKPETQVELNGKQAPASEIIYGQPNRDGQGQGQGQELQSQGQEGQAGFMAHGLKQAQVAAQKGLKLKAMFGGLRDPYGDYEAGANVNMGNMNKLLRAGYGFVIKYPNGGFNVITPRGFKFSDKAIQGLESVMKITPRTSVQWFKDGNLVNELTTDASVAIYGRIPAKRTPPAGLATPPPEL